MTTLILAFIFTTLAFGVFLYYYVWQHRFVTHIRLDIHKNGGRVVSIKRTLQKQKNLRGENHPEVGVSQIVWQVVYKDKFENIHETECRMINDQPHWNPPLL